MAYPYAVDVRICCGSSPVQNGMAIVSRIEITITSRSCCPYFWHRLHRGFVLPTAQAEITSISIPLILLVKINSSHPYGTYGLPWLTQSPASSNPWPGDLPIGDGAACWKIEVATCGAWMMPKVFGWFLVGKMRFENSKKCGFYFWFN